MTSVRSPISARLALLLAGLALLPGILALIAAGVGGDPCSSALAITEAAGACSVAALQGVDRRTVDAPVLYLPPPPAEDLFGRAPTAEADDASSPAARRRVTPGPAMPDCGPLRV